MDYLVSLAIGIGLSAACGFRVFVPLLGLSLAAQAGYVTMSPGFQWIAGNQALAAFGIATTVEIVAYYVPWLDHALDTITTPLSVAAGTIITASFLGEMDPFLKWTLALIAGGGAAGIFQTATTLTRGASTGLTGGLGNAAVSTGETVISIILMILSILIPLGAILLICVLIVFAVRRLMRKRKDKGTEGDMKRYGKL